MIDLEELSGFEWDEGNRLKNWKKHQVSIGECEQVFFNQPLILELDPNHSYKEVRYLLLGQTLIGRRLFIAFTIRKDKIRVISARDMNKKEKAHYDQASS